MEPKPGPEKDASKRADKKRCRKYLLGMILGLFIPSLSRALDKGM
jgi:hypothetical protein